MDMIYPKKAPQRLINKAEQTAKQVIKGAIKPSKTARSGYAVVSLGRCERMVIDGQTCHVFNNYSEFERFINKKH